MLKSFGRSTCRFSQDDPLSLLWSTSVTVFLVNPEKKECGILLWSQFLNRLGNFIPPRRGVIKSYTIRLFHINQQEPSSTCLSFSLIFISSLKGLVETEMRTVQSQKRLGHLDSYLLLPSLVLPPNRLLRASIFISSKISLTFDASNVVIASIIASSAAIHLQSGTKQRIS